MLDSSEHIERIVASAMDEVQRNAVPVIRRLLREAQEASRTPLCNLNDDSCESCQ